MVRHPKTFTFFVLLAISAASYFVSSTACAETVVFLTLDGGSGHRMIENAFKDALIQDPSARDLQVKSIMFNDYLTSSGARVNANYTWWAEHAPKLWDILQAATSKLPLALRRAFIRKTFEPALAAAIQQAHPDVIYCTHYSLAEIIDTLKVDGLLDPKIKVVNQLTDFSVIDDSLTRGLIIVPHEDLRDRLITMGKDPSMVKVVSGIPARPQFLSPYNREASRAALAARLASESGTDLLGTHDPLILASGGGDGRNLRFLADFLPSWHPDRPVKLAVICGKNEEILKRFEALSAAGRLDPKITLIPRGFETQMDEFMKAADIILSKPGGSSTAEVLALGKPLFVNTVTGIQEERNLKFLQDAGVAKTIQLKDLDHVSALLASAREMEASVGSEFVSAHQVPRQLIGIFNDYLHGRIPDSQNEQAALAADIQRYAPNNLQCVESLLMRLLRAAR